MCGVYLREKYLTENKIQVDRIFCEGATVLVGVNELRGKLCMTR